YLPHIIFSSCKSSMKQLLLTGQSQVRCAKGDKPDGVIQASPIWVEKILFNRFLMGTIKH
ncbi:MAG: hypothetical protein QF702_09840, partial [Prochlorococcaceae cyanobacterium ETNP2_MAG_10]|nr:hypothetical protein [Prochlorococcaceae cyanobacterium ETNP2_MAG_10]